MSTWQSQTTESKPTREYLLYKLAGKKHHYGYDVTPNHTLVHLPKRD